MFQGATALSLDAKGRLAVPARYRDALTPDGAPLVVTAHPHRCLLIYPKAAWAPISARVVGLPSFDKVAAQLKRLLIGYAQEEVLDSAGRVLLSAEARHWAGLDRQAYLVGQGECFELWSEARWREQNQMMETLDLDALSDNEALKDFRL